MILIRGHKSAWLNVQGNEYVATLNASRPHLGLAFNLTSA